MKTIPASSRAHYLARLCIFLIMAALIAGIMGCDGSGSDPYADYIKIYDWTELDNIRNNLVAKYVLMNDLDSTTAGYEELANPIASGGEGWQPIGTEDDLFTGTFDGQGYEIRDLCINRTDTYEDPVGLFGILGEGGCIENIGMVVNANFDGFWPVGGLVGENRGTMSNCYATGDISGRVSVGGLVGLNTGTVVDCYSSSSVIGRVYVGGLIGGISISCGTVIDSYATGSVTGLSVVGGLVGRNDGTVSNCHATGNITGDDFIGGLVGQCLGGDETSVSNSHSTGNVNGDKHIGGLVGQSTCIVSKSYSTGRVTGDFIVGGLVGDSGTMVSNSYSTGTVTGNWTVGGLVAENSGTVSNSYSSSDVIGETSNVAGLVGFNVGDVENSYSKGSVTGNMYVGGVVGNNWGNVSYSYSTGTVTGNEEVGGLVGRNLVGENIEGTVTNSFWDTETSGQATSAGGTGKTTAEMQDIGTFSEAGWNIVAVADPGTRNPSYIWNILEGQTYPFLSWQSVS